MVSQGERPFAVGILLQWFWSGVTLTGNETCNWWFKHVGKFWSGVTLTGNETRTHGLARIIGFGVVSP